MAICYVCYKCSRKLKVDGFHAVNEVGRKLCERCGQNHDDLVVIGKERYESALRDLKRRGERR